MDETTLLVDSDRAVLEVMKQEIRQKLGYRTLAAASCEEALRLARGHPVRLAVIDVDLPDGKGHHLIPALKLIRPALRVIMTSSDYSEETERVCRACGLVLYMAKPLDPGLFEAAIRTAWQSSPALGGTERSALPRMAGGFA
ncbi:MAG: response regulator [Deltaproteobacteria bacterium]|nr:response regulator [Deltaproteobacteria bacterium]